MKKFFVMIISSVLILNSFSLLSNQKSAFAASAKKMVLVELFTTQWCGYCPDANQKLDALYEDTQGKEFYFLKEHTSQGDELGNDYVDSRAAKMRVPGYPSTYVNSEKCDIRDVSGTKAIIQKHKSIKTNIAISVKGTIEKNQINIEVTYGSVPTGAKLNVVICQDFTYYNSSNGEKIHRYLVRTGNTDDLSGDGTKKYQFDINDKWASEMLRCIAFFETSSGVQNSAYTNFGFPEPNTTKPILSILPNTIILDSVKTDTSTSIDFFITNGGNKNGKVSFSSKESFIKVDSSQIEVSSKSQTKTNITIQTDGLPAGTYKGNIIGTGDGISKTIPVQFTILDKPQLQVSETSIDFGSVNQGEKVNQEIEIKNKVKGPITGTIGSKAKWISFNKKSFSSETVKIMISALTDKLETGEYSDEIQIKSDGGDKTISVLIKVSAPKIESIPGSIEFGEVFIDKLPFEEKTFIVKNIGEADASISLKSSPNFCDVKIDKKFTLKPGEEKKGIVTLVPERLEKDKTYNGKIILDWGSMMTEISVSASVKESPPVLEYISDAIKDGKIDISMKKGEKKEVIISFKNTGNGKLEIQASFAKDLPWISISAKTCALLKDQKKTITLVFDSSKVSTGSYDSLLKIVSNGGTAEVPIHIEITRDKIIIQLWIGNKNAVISGNPTQVDPPPYIRYGSTLVPLRFIGEAFGAVIDWQPKMGKGTINITLNTINILIEIGNKTAIVNGQKKTLTAPPEITGGRTFVPLRFIGEAFGADVKWNAATQGITLTY